LQEGLQTATLATQFKDALGNIEPGDDAKNAAEAHKQVSTVLDSVDHLLTVLPAAGADDQAVASAGQAVAYAQTIRDLVREGLESYPDTARIHLFLAGPGGLALLRGHRWNRTRPTIVYEHLCPGRGYTPAFTADA
jgi:SMODS-associated and fused to various effectors sensor domain